MAFDTSQPAYIWFRDTLKVRASPVLVFSGAGLSFSAGLPSWGGLRAAMTAQAKATVPHLAGGELRRNEGLIQAAENTTDLWEAFAFIKKALGDVWFIAAIREHLAVANSKAPPKVYADLWRLGIRGYLNLNVDRFATRALSSVLTTGAPTEFSGRDARYVSDILRGGRPFVANLHGTFESESSLVFTADDFKELMATPGYRSFIDACFLSCTVLFAGVTADDMAAGGHLVRLREAGLDLAGHFWITTRNEPGIRQWAEKAGIHQIYYDAPNNNHVELTQAIEDLLKFVPQDDIAAPVVPSITVATPTKLAEPYEVEKLAANEIRKVLNKEAMRILSSTSTTKLKEYEEFSVRYEEAIYRAWSASCVAGKNDFFDYKLLQPLARGAFGQVYRALNPQGKEVAIKILHGSVRESDMLQGFRRGVRAMKILSERGIVGMVPYYAQWEIPAATVMEYIDGPNLENAVESGFLKTWEYVLDLMWQVVEIIHRAHSVPERVLHRDIRPANIMLQQSARSNGEYDEVVVLDFDLAWHKDASEVSVNMVHSANGYLAPEQTELTAKASTRNALVDSFGIGMTFFFVVSTRHPQFGQYRHADWRDVLKREIVAKTCPSWKSLPRRVARLIEWSTKQEQSSRWDVTRIKGEIERLRDCLSGKHGALPCELLTEELAARCPDMSSYYEWDKERCQALLTLRSGFTVTLMADEPSQHVRVEIHWHNVGDKKYENVKKYVGTAADKCCAALKQGGWNIDTGGKHIALDSCRISGRISVSGLKAGESLNKAAAALGPAIHALRLS